MKKALSHKEFIVVYTVFVSVLMLFLNNNYVSNLGETTYLFDDAYIHLAIAENFSIHGIPSSDGVSPSNGSSSPLWLMYLTLLFTFLSKEVMTFIPLITNIASATILIIYIIKTFKSLNIFETPAGTITATLSAVFIIPLIPLTFVGMEHGLQALLALMFLYHSNEYIEKRDQNSNFKFMIAIGMLLPLLRYEMSLLVFIVTIYSLIKLGKDHFWKSFFLLSISAVPVILYGLYMVYLGLSFFPDSVMAKGFSGDNMIGIIFDDRPASQDRKMPIIFMLVLPYMVHILTMLIMLRLKFMKKEFSTPKTMLWGIAAGTMAIFQISFSMPTPVRYDGYLMAMGAVPLMEVVVLIFKRKRCTSYIPGALLLSGVFSLFLVSKLALGHTMMFFGVNNIHDQQRQTALFISDYAKAKKIAINDLGMVSFYTTAEIYDLEGLGTHEVALMKKNNTFSPEAIVEKISNNGTDWMIIYDEWYNDGNYIPSKCSIIGQTRIDMNLICGSDLVSFYYCGENISGAINLFDEFGADLEARTNGRAHIVQTQQ